MDRVAERRATSRLCGRRRRRAVPRRGAALRRAGLGVRADGGAGLDPVRASVARASSATPRWARPWASCPASSAVPTSMRGCRPRSALTARALRDADLKPAGLWARRSRILLRGSPLLVQEAVPARAWADLDGIRGRAAAALGPELGRDDRRSAGDGFSIGCAFIRWTTNELPQNHGHAAGLCRSSRA